MSAYIVSREHIAYIAGAAISPLVDGVYYNNKKLPRGDIDGALKAGRMLWEQNIKSVKHRYPGNDDLPGPIGEDFNLRESDLFVFHKFEPVQVLKSIRCLAYQSCEDDGWNESEAKAFLDGLTAQAIAALPGYEAAEWGAPQRGQQ